MQSALRELLATTPVTSLVGDRGLVDVDKDANVGDTLQLLADNHLLGVPVRDAEGPDGYRGFVDVLDLVSLLVEINKDNHGLDFERFRTQLVGDAVDKSKKDEWIAVDANESVLAVLGRFSKGLHRVALLASDGSHKIATVATQTDALRFCLQHESALSEVFSKTLAQLKLVKEWVLFVSKNDRAITSYKKMHEHKVSAVAVLDNKDLVASISASDLRNISTAKGFKVLTLPNLDFLSKQRGGDLTLSAICKPDDVLGDVVKKVVEHHFHRLWVVDHQMHPVGVVSLTDICGVIESHLG